MIYQLGKLSLHKECSYVEASLGLIFLVLIATMLAVKSSFLSWSGAAMAFLVGLCTALGFGIKGLLLMGAFFLSSSLFSKYKKINMVEFQHIHEKGSTRDWAQVLANGGLAALAGICSILSSDSIYLMAFGIALASSNSDTWASELGSLSKKQPISVRGFKVVASGTSGAISFVGTMAGLLGALFIAVLSLLLFETNTKMFFFIVGFGFIGMLIDTLLGAFLQAEYRCARCGCRTEKLLHCHQETTLSKGKAWMNNDVVNLLSGLLAVLLGTALY
nr:DUF92 domain-containing protein [Mesobacillus maritimus]